MTEKGPPVPWWHRITPLMADTITALDHFHCFPDEYYRRSTPKMRMLIRVALAFRAEQESMREGNRRQQVDNQRELANQSKAYEQAYRRHGRG